MRKFVDEANELTYSPLIQEFDHMQSFLNVRDFFLEAPSSLRKVGVHVSVLPAKQRRVKRPED